MRLYVEVARRTYARISAYRSATVAGVFTNTVFGFLIAYVLLAVYERRPEVGGFDAVDVVTFTFVAQGMLRAGGTGGLDPRHPPPSQHWEMTVTSDPIIDVVGKEAVREFLVAINREQGTTVLLTTHDLTDVERLCERLLIIDHGRLIEDGTVGGITARYGTERTLVVDLVEPGPPLTIDGAQVTRVEGPRQWLRFRRDDVTASALLARVTAQAEVRDLTVEEPDIESIVRAIYAR